MRVNGAIHVGRDRFHGAWDPALEPVAVVAHGGNVDIRDLTAGTTVYLPVSIAGAKFSLGDGHAAQGDGEGCGTAVETGMRALVRLTVSRGIRVTTPEFMRRVPVGGQGGSASPSFYATTGIGPDLLDAARQATRRMIDWLVREHHLAPEDAYLLCSVAVDLKIS